MYQTGPERIRIVGFLFIHLSKNRLGELPEAVGGFPFLERLLCHHNAIRALPDGAVVGALRCLRHLDLSRNQLAALPRELCHLPIQILLVSNNKLTSLPDELCRMSSLTELDASCNQIAHFPPRLGDLKNLQSLVLRNNLLLAVPVELTYLKLVRLDLTANRISILPIEMREMHTLIELMVDDNPLTSPPASLCKRGRVHIFKYLETEAIKLDRKTGGAACGTLSRRSRRSGAGSSPGPPHLADRLRNKRQNVDSGYSTSSDCCGDRRWSQEITGDAERHWPSTPVSARSTEGRSSVSTPSTISPGPDGIDEDLSKCSSLSNEYDRTDGQKNNVRLSPCTDNFANGTGTEDKLKPLQQIQTYREYKEALKQQRAQDVPSIYRTKDPEDQSYKTEPNTPTHQISTTLATSKSDPTPLNSAFGIPKPVFDDTPTKKPVQKVQPSRGVYSSPTHSLTNGSGSQEFVKPKSPLKHSTGILSHNNVPPSLNGKGGGGPRVSFTNGSPKNINGVKTTRTISWNNEVTTEKMSFTMRREIDKAREETDLINQLRNIIETRLKMALPEDLASALTDGVVLCHLANHIRPRSVASIHVPSPAVPKLTMARCRRNVDNFIEACRKIGVDEGRLCASVDIVEGLTGLRGLRRLLDTVWELCETSAGEDVAKPERNEVTWFDTTVSLLLLAMFVATAVLLVVFPPPD